MRPGQRPAPKPVRSAGCRAAIRALPTKGRSQIEIANDRFLHWSLHRPGREAFTRLPDEGLRLTSVQVEDHAQLRPTDRQRPGSARHRGRHHRDSPGMRLQHRGLPDGPAGLRLRLHADDPHAGGHGQPATRGPARRTWSRNSALRPHLQDLRPEEASETQFDQPKHLIHVYGADRKGIIHRISQAAGRARASISPISTPRSSTMPRRST